MNTKITFGLFRNYGALNSVPVFDAFEQGVKKLGHTVVDGHTNTADVAVIWSVLWHGRMAKNQLVLEEYEKNKKPVIVLEVGGLIRNKTWKVGVGGINNEAFFGHCTNNDDYRFKKLGISLNPWRLDGENIIICCQNEKSHQWRNMPSTKQWLLDIIPEIRRHTDKKIVIRPHPRNTIELTFSSLLQTKFKNVSINTPQQIQGTYDDFDFQNQLKNAWAVVNWSSNPATQAILSGIPVFTGPDSLASPVANLNFSTIDNPTMPDRTQWANDIAYTEWTVEEIADGTPIFRLLDKIRA